MQLRSMFKNIFSNKSSNEAGYKRFELLNSTSNTFSAWNGNIFSNDIVRSAIRPKANAVGKLNAKHIFGFGEDIKINSIPFIRDVLENPNPYMSMQDFLTKMIVQREIYHNAFAYVKKNEQGYVTEIYPIPYSNVELVEKEEILFIKFRFRTGKTMIVLYEDVMHLRKDFNDNDIFGDSGNIALTTIMDVITTTDQGIVNAVKNSAVIKWILKFKNTLRQEDIDMNVKKFTENYLSIAKNEYGAAYSDPRYDLEKVEDKSYVPNAAQMKESIQRLYSYFGVNDAIVQNKYDENQWNAFYESEIEPIAIQLSNAFTKVFFSKRERGFGNKIVFEASNLQYASMTTKLGLVQMVDRGALTPNEWRLVLNLSPIEGGDKPIRRLDTAEVGQTNTGDKEEQSDGNKST